jgi:hypothetical protein
MYLKTTVLILAIAVPSFASSVFGAAAQAIDSAHDFRLREQTTLDPVTPAAYRMREQTTTGELTYRAQSICRRAPKLAEEKGEAVGEGVCIDPPASNWRPLIKSE